MADRPRAGAGSGGGSGAPGDGPGRKAVRTADHRSQLIGIGALASLLIGYAPLRDAFTGTGSFETAVGRYLLCLGASVGAAVLLGHLLSGAPPPDDEGEKAGTRGPTGR